MVIPVNKVKKDCLLKSASDRKTPIDKEIMGAIKGAKTIAPITIEGLFKNNPKVANRELSTINNT
jgi:hypothetical protein